MRKVTMTLALAALPFFAYAQGTETVQRSSNPQGMRVQGNSSTQAEVGPLNTNATSADNENPATNPAAANIKNNTQIQGNTTIKAKVQNINAVASGKTSSAGNEVGAIGK